MIQSWPGVVVVSGDAIRAAAEVVLIGIRYRRQTGLPQSKVHEELAAAFIAASASGHVDTPDVGDPQPLSTTVTIVEAAKRMKCSPRQARRLAPKLGGRIIAGRWLLDHQAIEEHVEGRHG